MTRRDQRHETDVDRPSPRRGDVQPPSAQPAAPSGAPHRRPGERIGSYETIRLLGEGGMGQVYLAEQKHPLERIVAIKLMRTAIASSTEIHRFEAERQALARLNHPNIAQVFEAGDTEQGQPFIVMEYVEGEPILEYCDHHRLSVEERLDLFTAVCDGIHHAHQKGILHRDIKPSNILVTETDGKPVVKVIDFGIAKALDEVVDAESRTRDGMISGTPAYLSPESIERTPDRQDIDIRSDVYSLGVLLGELLTGQTPFGGKGQNLVQTMVEITTGEPPAPSALFGSLDSQDKEERARLLRLTTLGLALRLRGDLDWIVLKAVERDRDRRYDSAAALATDILRHRQNVPVNAGPPSRVYRLGKFFRRHRVGMAASVVAALALTVAVASRTQEARRANRAAETARRAQLQSEEVVNFLVDLFAVSDPGRARGEDITARELLDRGAERIRGELGDQPEVRARLLDVIGSVYREMGYFERAAVMLEEALGVAGQSEISVARRHQSLASLYWQQGKYDESDNHYEQALEIRERLLGADHLLVAESVDGLASSYRLRSKVDEAEALYRRAIAIRESQLSGDSPDLAASYHNLAVLFFDNGRTDEAAPLFERGLAIRVRTLGEDHPEVAHSANGLGMVLSVQNETERAEAAFRRALAIRRKVLDPGHPDLAQSLNNLASELVAQDRMDEAEPLMREALEVYEGSLGPDHYRVGIGLHNLADFLRENGRYGEAEPAYRRAAEIFVTALEPEHLNVSYPLKGLGDVFTALGRYEEAESMYRRALEIRVTHLGDEHKLVEDVREAITALGTAAGGN